MQGSNSDKAFNSTNNSTNESSDEELLIGQNAKAVSTLYSTKFTHNFTCANPYGSKYPALDQRLKKSFAVHLKFIGFNIEDEKAKTFPCGSIFEVIEKILLRVNLSIAKKGSDTGAKEAVFFMPASSFGYMAHTAQASGCRVVILKLDENGLIDKNYLQERLNVYKDYTKVFTMINPNNPRGDFWSQEEVNNLTHDLNNVDFIIEDATFAGITREALRKELNAPLDDDFAKRSTEKYEDFAKTKEDFKNYIQQSKGFKSSHIAGSFFNSALQNKTILFYSPAKELSAEHRISCFVMPKQLISNLKQQFALDVEGGLGGFNFNKDCQNNTIKLLNDKTKAIQNTLYYITRFKQVKAIIREFNTMLSSKFKMEYTEFAKLTLEAFEAGNIVTIDFSGLKGFAVDGKILKNDLEVFEKLAYHVKAGLVPGSANFTNSSKMQLRIVLGEEYESYYGFEKGLCNFVKPIHAQENLNETKTESKIANINTTQLSKKLVKCSDAESEGLSLDMIVLDINAQENLNETKTKGENKEEHLRLNINVLPDTNEGHGKNKVLASALKYPPSRLLQGKHSTISTQANSNNNTIHSTTTSNKTPNHNSPTQQGITPDLSNSDKGASTASIKGSDSGSDASSSSGSSRGIAE
jgi:aspartate/methionine/tyrosine aminotransferase